MKSQTHTPTKPKDRAKVNIKDIKNSRHAFNIPIIKPLNYKFI